MAGFNQQPGDDPTGRLSYLGLPQYPESAEDATTYLDLTEPLRRFVTPAATEYAPGRASVPLEPVRWREVVDSPLSKGAVVGLGQYAAVQGGDRRGWWTLGDGMHTQRLIAVIGLERPTLYGIMALRRVGAEENTLQEDTLLLVKIIQGNPTEAVGLIPNLSDPGKAPLQVEGVQVESRHVAVNGFRVGYDRGSQGPQVVVTDLGAPNGTRVFVPRYYMNDDSREAFGGRASALDPRIAMQYLEHVNQASDPWSTQQ